MGLSVTNEIWRCCYYTHYAVGHVRMYVDYYIPLGKVRKVSTMYDGCETYETATKYKDLMFLVLDYMKACAMIVKKADWMTLLAGKTLEKQINIAIEHMEHLMGEPFIEIVKWFRNNDG